MHNHVHPSITKGEAKLKGRLAASQHLHLAIQLPLRNQDELKSFLTRLSDPSSPDYHKYLSVEQFTEKYGPTQADYQAVVDYAKTQGMTVMSTPKNRMFVEVDGAAPVVEKALHVTMNTYQHPTENRTFYSADRDPSLELSVPLQHITGLDNYSIPKPKNSTTWNPSDPYPPAPTGSGPYNSYLLSDIRQAYYGGTALTGAGQAVGIFEFTGYDLSDVEMNFTSVGQTNNVPVNNVLLGGLTAPMAGGASEPVLDIVSALGMAPGLSQVLVYECCSDTYSGSLSGAVVILNQMATDNIAKQLSCSYGYGAEPEAEDPIYQEMAAQGQTYFAATGDYGSPQNPGNNVEDDYYPSDDAWVTAVSMSLVFTDGAAGPWASEIYAGGAGGGYSDGPTPTPIPSWQLPAINASNGGSTLYRNVPDVVMDGYGLYMCANGACYPNSTCQTCTNGGSSWAAPMWAGFNALINQQAEENKQGDVGFLNPALYALGENPTSFANDYHDIIGGNNGCCGQPVYYTAVPGYDLVGGWGSPNGQTFIDDLLNSTATPSFSLIVASPASVSIGPSDSGSVTVEVGAIGGFTGNVTLTASGLPSGVTASFNPNPAVVTGYPATPATSVLTLTSNGSPTVGNYTVTLTGTAGSVSATTTIPLSVTATQGNFTIGSATTVPYLAQGGSVTDQLIVTSVDNFASTVNLTATGLPAGVTAVFSPAAVIPNNSGCPTASPCASSTLTLSADTTAVLGTVATVTITGTAGALTQSTTIQLTVSGALSTFTPTVAQGGSISFSYATSSSFATSINYVSVFPANCVPLWNNCQPWNGNLNQSAPGTSGTVTFDTSSLTPGVYWAYLNYNGGEVTLAGPVVFTVTPATDFTLSVDPTQEPSIFGIGQGGATAYTLWVNSLGTFNSPVALSLSGLPSGVTAVFTPSTITPPAGGNATVTLTLTGSPSVPIGTNSNVTITGTSGAIQKSLTALVGVGASFTANATSVPNGGNLVLNYNIDPNLVSPNNWVGIFPQGVSPFNQTAWAIYPNPYVTTQTGSTTISTAAGNGFAAMPSGTYDAWLFWNNSWQILAGPVTFTISDFAITSSSAFLNLAQGGTATNTITLTANGNFSSAVTFSVSGLPSGVTAAFSPASVTPAAGGTSTTTLTLTHSGGSAMGGSNRQPWLPASLLALLLAPFGRRFIRARRKFLARTMLLAAGLLLMLLGPISCGGNFNNSNNAPTPSGPATVTVTANSGTESVSTSFSLLVQ